jgi:hypothetical protein
MDDMSAELRQSLEELQEINAEFDNEFGQLFSRWGFSLGLIKIDRPLNALFISQVFIVFDIVCFAAGVALAFVGGAFTTIGTALIVGALFSFGALVAQLWVTAFQDEINVHRTLDGEDHLTRAKELRKRQTEIFQHIENLNRLQSNESTESQ